MQHTGATGLYTSLMLVGWGADPVNYCSAGVVGYQVL